MDRCDENLHRTVVWGFLAAAFRHPGDELGALAKDLPRAAEALGLAAGSALCAPTPRGRLREAHDVLFGHTVRGPCPAHESEYGEPKGLRLPHEIGDAQGFYRAFGLQPSRRLGERADHVSVECEFLAFLALKEACALEAHGEAEADTCRHAARDFLKNHLGRFGRAFAGRVRRRAEDPFHAAAAELLDTAILGEAARLGVTAGPADLPLRDDAGTPDDACVRCGLAGEAPR